jgi:hypothetical protein
MFTAVRIKNRLDETPFRPFKMYMSDGSAYEVPHLDVALVFRYGVEVGIELYSESIPGKAVMCSMLHISRIEDLDLNASRKRQRKG